MRRLRRLKLLQKLKSRFFVGVSTFLGGGGGPLVKSFIDCSTQNGIVTNSPTNAFLNYQSSRLSSKFSKFTTTPFKPFLEKSTMGGVLQINIDAYFKIITTVVKNEIKEDIKGNPSEEVKK